MTVPSRHLKVDERTHARLAELAAEHGTTIGGYVGELASAQRTYYASFDLPVYPVADDHFQTRS